MGHWLRCDGRLYLQLQQALLVPLTLGRLFPNFAGLSFQPLHFSEPAKRRSLCGSVRGRPVLSSHFSFGFAPQVGHRTAKASCFLDFMASRCTVA